jgi:hypothetical protein
MNPFDPWDRLDLFCPSVPSDLWDQIDLSHQWYLFRL